MELRLNLSLQRFDSVALLSENRHMKYPWKRFWCPREGVINLSDGGFLYDPDSKHAEWVQRDVVPFERIEHQPCLALLGEPGIGKTTAIEELGTSLRETIDSSGDCLLYMNLNEYGNESRLIQEIFGCEDFVRWKQGNHVLHLFLDSLDECALQIHQVAAILTNQFRSTSSLLSRLRLRIACRTADWPVTLEQSLPQLWGEDNFAAYELCPLRRKDIEEAAQIEGIDAAKFMEEIERTESVALAFKPVTLRFLITVFRSDGELPPTRTGLYEKGCIKLCSEMNPSRQDLSAIGGTGKLSPEDRLNIASRIGAITIFSGKTSVCTGNETEFGNVEQALISELAGAERLFTTERREVSQADIKETLGTGLFSSRGPNLMGFVHQTYAEFLASRYLRLHSIPPKKTLTLLRHSGDSAHMVPQLHQVAAWVASQDRQVFVAIARDEPEILLHCDEGALSEEQRAELTQSYLEGLHEGRTSRRGWGLYRHYQKLSHPGLHERLFSWITDGSKNLDARHTAIDIVETCNVTSLQSVLADLALNEDEAEYLRSNAAHAVAKIGDPDTRRRLRPLAFGQSGQDAEDQLKGNALRALWPDLISPEELFNHLAMPKRESFFGAYRNFVEHELSNHLDAARLPDALKWLEIHAEHCGPGFPFRLLAADIIIRGWKCMDDPEVLEALANTSIELMKHHHNFVFEADEREEHVSLFDEVSKRRKLAKAIVEQGMTPDNAFLLTAGWDSPRLLKEEDFEWSVNELVSSISQPTEGTWAALVWALFRRSEPSGCMLDQLVEARLKSTKLREESVSSFASVELDSEQARKMRRQYEQFQRLQQKKEPKLLDWLPKDRIQSRLALFEQGNKEAWWVLLREMTLEDTSERYKNLFNPEIRQLPGWANSDEKTRTRILGAAETYLRSKCSFDQARLLRGSADEQDIAGYKAFLLLMNERPDVLASLNEDIWIYWTPIFFGPFGYDEDRQAQRSLISVAYKQVPDNVAVYLKEIIRHEIGKEQSYISALELVENIWDQRIAIAVFSMLAEAQVKPLCWGRLLRVLLNHADDSACSLAENKLSSAVPEAQNERLLVLQAALVMMQEQDDCAWHLIWPILQAEEDFGRDLIKEFAHELHHDAKEFACKLTEAAVADLFIWLVRQFPYATDSQYDGPHSPTKEDAARELRNRLIDFLEKVGTPASCQAIRRIAQTLTEFDWLQTVFIEARKNTLQSTWRPLQPTEFLQVTSQSEAVLVRDAAELQELLIDALHVLQQMLQGETPAAPDLWDAFRPKDENHLSDWIKRNLELEMRGRGIVVAREVELRRGEGSGTGERSDIHVTAVVPGLAENRYDQVRVIVEAKGCWNRDLQTAMETQLVNRYLNDNECDHGIYLVGWYVCNQWEKGDRRRTDTPDWSFQEAIKFFEEQAAKLSASGPTIRAAVLNTALR